MMPIEEIFHDLKKLIHEEVYLHGGKYVHHKEVYAKMQDLNREISKDYAVQRGIIPYVLGMYEEYRDHVLQYQVDYFRTGLMLLKKKKVVEMNLHYWDEPFDIMEIFPRYMAFMTGHLTKGSFIRIAQHIPLTIDKKTGHEYLRLIHKVVGKQAMDQHATPDDVEGIALQLMFARSIAIAIDEKELFYFIASLYIDGIHFREDHQYPKDIAEECVITSYIDGIPEMGHYISFRVFAWSSSSVTAFHYANVAIQILLQRPAINNFLLKSLFSEGIKLMRNLMLFPFAIEIFDNRPTHIEYSEYDFNRLMHSYVSCLIYIKAADAPSRILDFLDSRKELIISSGETEAMPWLVLLFNIVKNYKDHEYDSDHLNQYVELFKRIVPAEMYIGFFNALFGSYVDVKKDLQRSLEKLSATRNPSDFVTDNTMALKRSHRLLLLSYEDQKVDGYLLSMILQSDFSLLFQEKDTDLIIRGVDSLKVGNFEELYNSPDKLTGFIMHLPNSNLLWLGTDKHLIMPMFYNGVNFSFPAVAVKELYHSYNFIKKNAKQLAHDVMKKKNSCMIEKEFHDYEAEEKEILDLCQVCTIDFQPSETLLIVKDIDISDYPHNLLRNDTGFIMKSVSLCNIMSVEWLFRQPIDQPISWQTKSIYIPTESGDYPVNILHSRMEELLVERNIIQYTQVLPTDPISSDLNIVVAHGTQDIQTSSALFLNNTEEKIAITNLDRIIGAGKILLLFVCHSGSEKTDRFSNQVLTVVKDYIQKGYSAVVAPFWALHIDIPPIWLKTFLEEFETGTDISTAVFRANMSVADVFNTPKAYACLHLYGNPYLKIDIAQVRGLPSM